MERKDLTWRPLGAACVALGLAAIYIASGYPYGTVTAMGPGFVPTAVAAIFVLLGVSILLVQGRDLPAKDDDDDEQPRSSVGLARAMASILGAIIVFGLAIRPFGLALTAFAVTMIGGAGHPGVRWRELTLLAIGIAVASCVIFVLLLSQAIPMFPRFG